LKDDLAIRLPPDLSPAIHAIKSFGARTRIGFQSRGRMSAGTENFAGKRKQGPSYAAPFVKRVDEKRKINPSRESAAENPWIAPSSSHT
jgi:hypothetical protein